MARVLKTFRCKVTKRVYQAGSEYDGDRVAELQALGFVEPTGGGAGKQAPPTEPAKLKRKRKGG